MGSMLKCDAPGWETEGALNNDDNRMERARNGAAGLIPRADYSEARFRAQELYFKMWCAGVDSPQHSLPLQAESAICSPSA